MELSLKAHGKIQTGLASYMLGKGSRASPRRALKMGTFMAISLNYSGCFFEVPFT
jgi:hypothetical protein